MIVQYAQLKAMKLAPHLLHTIITQSMKIGDYAEMLPILDIGEALIVGDASLLPSRIRIAPPKLKPRSATIDFWDEWAKETSAVNIRNAIEALRKQSK